MDMLSTQSLPKFHPDFDVVIDGILKAVPDALLVIVYNKEKTMWKSKLEHRMARSVPSLPACLPC